MFRGGPGCHETAIEFRLFFWALQKQRRNNAWRSDPAPFEFPRKPVSKQKSKRAAYLCLHAPENNPGRNNMTTMINEAGAPAGVINRNSGGRLAFDGNRPAINADALGADPRGAADLPLDQTFPRLLYELAVRLPALREIQAVCVWLYEPVRHAIRPHLLMADLPPERRSSMAFPIDDSIAAWVWKHQQPLTINTQHERRFPDFAAVLLESGMKSFCGVPLMIANRPIGVLGLASTASEAFRDFNWEFVQRGPGNTTSLARMLHENEISTQEKHDSSDESLALEEEAEPIFKGIIGRSPEIGRAHV